MGSFKCGVEWDSRPITEHYCDFLHSRHGNLKSLTVVRRSDQPYYWRSEIFHNSEFPMFHPVFYRQLIYSWVVDSHICLLFHLSMSCLPRQHKFPKITQQHGHPFKTMSVSNIVLQAECVPEELLPEREQKWTVPHTQGFVCGPEA